MGMLHVCERPLFQERFKLEKDQPPSGGGRFRAIIDTVIGNLQLSITNVHIRFEVPYVSPPLNVAYLRHKPYMLLAILKLNSKPPLCVYLRA